MDQRRHLFDRLGPMPASAPNQTDTSTSTPATLLPIGSTRHDEVAAMPASAIAEHPSEADANPRRQRIGVDEQRLHAHEQQREHRVHDRRDPRRGRSSSRSRRCPIRSMMPRATKTASGGRTGRM